LYFETVRALAIPSHDVLTTPIGITLSRNRVGQK